MYFPLKHDRYFFILEKGKKKQYISYKISFIKIFLLVIAVTQEQGLNSGHSCLNAALKLLKDVDSKTTTLLVKKRAQGLSVALKANDGADLLSSR